MSSFPEYRTNCLIRQSRDDAIYDLNGRITQTTLPDLPAAYHNFDYDNLNRLTRAETIGVSVPPPLQEPAPEEILIGGEGWGGDGVRYIYTYDSTGNRTAKIVNGNESVYINERQSNRLLRVEGSTNLVTESYEYDAVGSTVSRLTTNSADTFVYDARGRLIQANTTSYKINALEQRIEKQGLGADTPSGVRHFVYDEAGQLIGEYDPVSGNPMIEHVWLGNIPVAAIKGNQIFYVYPDHLGTPRAITDTGNNTVWYWNYDEPFGETEANENPNGAGVFAYNLRFPGQYFDSETGLHYNWHRDYNPAIGKYIQSDPIGLEGGLNTYLYALGAPLILFDIMGLAPQERCDDKCTEDPEIGKPCAMQCTNVAACQQCCHAQARKQGKQGRGAFSIGFRFLHECTRLCAKLLN